MVAKGFSSRSELESLDDNVKKTVSALPWFKRVGRWFRLQQRHIADRRLRHEISRLEKARAQEKTALSEQRRFYERLFRRKLKIVEPVREKPIVEQKPIQKSTPEVEPKPVLATPSLPEIEPKTVIAASDSDAPSEVGLMSRISEPSVPSEPEKKKSKPAVRRFKLKFFSRNLAHKLAEEREREQQWQDRNTVEKRFWQPYNGLKPNLVRDHGTVFFNWEEHLLVLGLSLVMCCLAIGLVYVGLLVWQKERLENNRVTQLNSRVIDAEIAKNEQDVQAIAAFNDKLKLTGALLDNHVYWTNFLSLLEDNTLKDVYYEKLSGTTSGEYVIPAVGRNLETISLQLEVLKAYKGVKSVSYDTSQTKTTANSVRFNLGMSIDPSLFAK